MSSHRILSRRDFLSFNRPAASTPGADSGERVHIVSLLVHAIPAQVAATQAALADVAGVELQATAHAGKFIVLLETSDEQAIADCVNQLHACRGVITVSVIAHLIESVETLDEEISHGRDSSSISQG